MHFNDYVSLFSCQSCKLLHLLQIKPTNPRYESSQMYRMTTEQPITTGKHLKTDSFFKTAQGPLYDATHICAILIPYMANRIA